ncbi:MAG: aspartate aminotransferase family protein [Lautropia sp.]|nr:aspartate aminotransferase family protein [Lautropia sp.]
MSISSDQLHLRPEEMESLWMPFTANRQFKSAPRLLARAEGMYYWDDHGRKILDGIAGMWCSNLGHNHPKVVEAIRTQAAVLDYAPPFQMANPLQFELANRVGSITPKGMSKVFYTNSGSESVDTALKIALAYHRVRGEGSRVRLIGRERGYHGVGFGGISVGGMGANRKMFGSLITGVDHMPQTWNLKEQAYSRGQPAWGAHLADELERIVALHDASTIAAVIVEPVAGSAGVLVPPVGYLERLREICTRHGILLIFDEVITGFGRLGKAFGAEYFNVQPDLMTLAKGITSGTVPMGAVVAKDSIYETFMSGPPHAIELFHGYTYSGHPLACAAGIAVQQVYQEENLFARAAEMAPHFEAAVHSLKGSRHVIDCRNLGLMGAIELQPREGAPTARSFEAFLRCYEQGVLIRTTGDIIALTPSLIVEKAEIDRLVTTIAEVLKTLD